MKGLSPDLIAKLTSGGRSAKTSTGRRPVETPGHFEAKQGTIRRSRKGRTYRLANGYCYYCPDWSTVRWHKGLTS